MTRERHDDLASVVIGYGPLNQSDSLESVDESDGAVVRNLELLGEFPDRYPVPARESFDREQRLILLGFESVRSGGFLAKTQKNAQGVAEFSE